MKDIEISQKQSKSSSNRDDGGDEEMQEEGIKVKYEENRDFVKYKNFYISKHKYDLLMSSNAC